ncbi:MAG: VanW family protein [Clostridia bacterium]|nr:VanW family protein [Clostridia bacterium]
MPSMTKAGYVPPQMTDKKPTKKQGGKKKRRKRSGPGAAAFFSLVIFLLACLVGAGTIYVYAQTAPYADAFLPGTMLLGYPLEGATMEEAQALLEQITREDINDFTAELRWGNQSYILSAQDLALTVDAHATLDPLWQRGREGGMLACFAEMLRLKQAPMIAQPIVTFDMTAADELLGLIHQDIACEPADAKVAFMPGSAEPFSFTGETIGYSLNLTDVRAQIERAAGEVTSAVIALEPEAIMPGVMLDDLKEAIVLRSRIVVEIDGEKAAYSNVTLAAKAINGAAIAPSGVFSFNETVGERSAARGYLSAQEPAYGEGISGVGGGVCRLSSALYRLALLGGIPVTQRSAAVRPVDYCEIGQEAAVSDQGIDLAFENPTAYPLFISARTYMSGNKAYLELQLIGEPLDGRYSLISAITQETLVEEPVYVRDHEGKYARYDDERVEAGEAKPGYSVVVDRVKLDAEGNELSRENISFDEYAPVPPAIYIGTQKRE